MLILIVDLLVRRDALDAFHDFERIAAAVMATHGGRIERVLVVEHDAAGEHREVHLVAFPDEAALGRYRDDPAMVAARPLREAAVLRTTILRGVEAPGYGP